MLNLLASTDTHSRTLSRRRILQVGGLAPVGLALPGWLQGNAAAADRPTAGAPRSFGRAKRCLLIFMWGGPAHQDLWDLKPDAPAGIRGEFQPAATNVPGVQISELLPRIGQQMDKIALVRSVTHSDNNHSTSAHWMLTGHKHRLSAENFHASANDFPHVGSVVSKLHPAAASVPTFVALPERIATTIGAVVPGQNGGVLGSQYDPLAITDHPDRPDFKVEMLAERAGLDNARLAGRQELREQFNAVRRELAGSPLVDQLGGYYAKAADLVTSAAARRAFDLQQEPARERDRYGRGTFGQSLLLARRLLEAGVGLVTVYWHRDMPGVDTTWDTHAQNFQQLKQRLVPQIDQPIATLLADLADRGLLDDTLVVWSSEFGRTPKINANAGRDHWGACNSVWLAGAGTPGGQVFGSSDKHAAFPADNPVAPADVTATIFHRLGIRPEQIVHDREGRPHTISHGRPIAALL